MFLIVFPCLCPYISHVGNTCNVLVFQQNNLIAMIPAILYSIPNTGALRYILLYTVNSIILSLFSFIK